MKRTSFTLPFLVLATLPCVTAGCAREDHRVHSNLSTVVDERSVHATVLGPATIRSDGDGALISTETHKIAVESERVLLDGIELVTLPAATKRVDVAISDDAILSVEADRVEVATKQLPK